MPRLLGPLRSGSSGSLRCLRWDLHEMSESRRHGRCTDDRTGSHQPFPARIHVQVQTFQRARAEQLEIALFGKDDLIHRLRLIDPKYGIADRARNDLAVRQLKLE